MVAFCSSHSVKETILVLKNEAQQFTDNSNRSIHFHGNGRRWPLCELLLNTFFPEIPAAWPLARLYNGVFRWLDLPGHAETLVKFFFLSMGSAFF